MKTDWHDLIERYVSGVITDTESQLLERQLKADPALRDRYLDAVNLDSALEAATESAQTALRLPMSVSERALASENLSASNRLKELRTVAAVAAVLIASSLMILQRYAAHGSIAELIEVRQARWESSNLPTEPGSRLAKGRLCLAEGLARLRFGRGAEVTLEGPAVLELLGEQVCRLHRGSLLAHVPELARGFSVLTPNATLVDHGTDFGVSTDVDGHARVHVMRGEVELQHASGAKPVRLTTQQMTDITLQELLPPRPLEAEPQLRAGRAPVDRFTAELTTRAGSGAAAYVSEPRTGENQSDTLLLLKNCAEPGYGRKVLLRFDLRELANARAIGVGAIQDARLVLHFGPTGLGYASQGGEAMIGVYALTDEAADEWQAHRVTWETQPAFEPESGRVNEAKAVRVGEFTVPHGVQTGSFSVEGPRLLAMLKSDANGLLTLILVRENRIEVGGGLVLGIAGNRHPSLPPPTLRVR